MRPLERARARRHDSPRDAVADVDLRAAGGGHRLRSARAAVSVRGGRRLDDDDLPAGPQCRANRLRARRRDPPGRERRREIDDEPPGGPGGPGGRHSPVDAVRTPGGWSSATVTSAWSGLGPPNVTWST